MLVTCFCTNIRYDLCWLHVNCSNLRHVCVGYMLIVLTYDMCVGYMLIVLTYDMCVGYMLVVLTSDMCVGYMLVVLTYNMCVGYMLVLAGWDPGSHHLEADTAWFFSDFHCYRSYYSYSTVTSSPKMLNSKSTSCQMFLSIVSEDLNLSLAPLTTHISLTHSGYVRMTITST